MIRAGFSLLELLVVVAVIGILSAVGVVGYQRYIEATRIDAANASFDRINKGIADDIISFSYNLGGQTNLTAGREQLTVFGSNSTALGSCEAFAISIVEELNGDKYRNSITPGADLAVYGNMLSTAPDGSVSGTLITAGTMVIACNNPTLMMDDVNNVRMYQCLCTQEPCQFTADADLQGLTEDAKYQDDRCPRPQITANANLSGDAFNPVP